MNGQADRLQNIKRFREFMSGLSVSQKAHLLLVLEQAPIDYQWTAFNYSFTLLIQMDEKEWNEVYQTYKDVR